MSSLYHITKLAMSNLKQPINKNSIFTRIKLIFKAFWFGIDWAWNPTHTYSAIIAVESFINQKNNYPNLQIMLDTNPKMSKTFSSLEFIEDMSKNWNFSKLRVEYSEGSLAVEYVKFMERLNFEPLDMNFSLNIPQEIQSILKLGIRNHDIIHLLFGLYQSNSDGKLDITDYHEWIFLSWTASMVRDFGDRLILDFLLFPSRIKAFLTFNSNHYNEAIAIGQELAKTSADLNLTWLKPYFGESIESVRQKLGIKTLDEVLYK